MKRLRLTDPGIMEANVQVERFVDDLLDEACGVAARNISEGVSAQNVRPPTSNSS